MEKIKIISPNAQNEITIIPRLGGMLSKYVVNGVSVIDGIQENSLLMFPDSELKKGALLFPFPTSVKNGIYTFNNRTYKLSKNSVDGKHASNGLLLNQYIPFNSSVLKMDLGRIELKTIFSGFDGFPFLFECKIIYTLNDEGSLNIRFKISNKGKRAFPFGLGWFPFFNILENEQMCIDLPAISETKLDANGLCISDEEYCDELDEIVNKKTYQSIYRLSSDYIRLISDYKDIELILDRTLFPYVELEKNSTKTIGIKPCTCYADAFNDSRRRRVLEPMESVFFQLNIHVNIKKTYIQSPQSELEFF